MPLRGRAAIRAAPTGNASIQRLCRRSPGAPSRPARPSLSPCYTSAMSTATRIEVDAVFEAGVFRPLTPPALTNGAHVHLFVEAQPPNSDPIELAGRVYDGLSQTEIEAIEALVLDRSTFSRDRSLP